MISLLMILLVGLVPWFTGGSEPLADAAGMKKGFFVFSYPARDGVEGNEYCVRFGFGDRGESRVYFRGSYIHDDEYWAGDVVARCRVRQGRVVEIEYTVLNPSSDRPKADRDLGAVSGSQATTFFLQLVRGEDDDLAEAAIMGAAVAGGADIIRPFIKLARDSQRPDTVREQALFWLAILAGQKAIEPIQGLIADEDEDLDLRRHAVFALSQLDEETAFPLLMEVARNHPNPEIQRSAFLWIAEFDRPEVVNLFEEILVDR